ncbi:MAG: acetate--CoA ligase [Anaerolineales bacterium]
MLETFFNPRGIVVLGASRDPRKLGYGLARNLVQSGYPGVVHFVNPSGGHLLGRPVYPAVAEAPNPADLAVILVPAPHVPASLQACGERGIRAAIIAAGGFRETGPDGAALEARCLEIARQYHMRLIGPNCIGLLDTHLPLDTTFLPPPGPPPGDVAFISHSGAICAAVIDWARGQGFGLSRLVSLGNQADLSETDLLAPTADDPRTRVLTLYLEGVSDGRRFVQAARQVACRKPVVALKVGRFESGQKAVASHTGALAGSEQAFNAAFRRAGVLRAETSEEMFDWARALAWCPLPQGPNVAVLTNAGGPGVTAADALEALGLKLAPLSESTRAALRALLPPAASLHNPVDMLASASPEQYAAGLRILLDDPQVHSVMVVLPPPPMFTAGAVARAIIPIIQTAEKPVVVALMGERLIQEAVEHLRAARVPEYRFPERAASALAILHQRAAGLARCEAPELSPQDVDREQADSLLADAAPKGWLPPEVAASLLGAYGIRVPRGEVARSPEEATSLAAKVGFPAALKIVSPDIAHKSDVGGILLDISSPDEAAQGYKTLMQRVARRKPQARLDGVLVQPMIPAGQEVIVGVVRDAQFGPLVMFGSGGVEVEGLKDVAFALAPLTAPDLDDMLRRTWAGRKLRGYRNIPPADEGAVREALIRLAQLAADHPQISEIEINPLRVLAPGQSAAALDVRVRLVP